MNINGEQYINIYDLVKDYARLIDGQRKEIDDLQAELEYYRGVAEQLGAEKAVSQRDKMIKESEEIEQILGKALGYPWYKDDPTNFPNATEADGVCVSPNTAASLAMHAADKIKMMGIRELDKQKMIDSQEEDIARMTVQDGFESGYQIGYKSGLAAFNKE
jgi:hypothetical protein